MTPSEVEAHVAYASAMGLAADASVIAIHAHACELNATLLRLCRYTRLGWVARTTSYRGSKPEWVAAQIADQEERIAELRAKHAAELELLSASFAAQPRCASEP